MSVLPTTINGLGRMESAIQDAVRKRIEDAVNEEVALAQKRVAQRVPEIVSGIALNIFKYMSMEHMRDELRIVVKIPETPA